MCGIVGIVTRKKGIRVKTILREMTDVISHRGPDESGFFESTASNGEYYIGIGHRRLSIIDLKTGQQPMANEDKTIHIILNGEIYNFYELKNKLIKCGHRFATNSDTETIIHAYEEWGDSCINELRGMFSFALWDTKRERLILVRDRFGKKPLFLYYKNDTLLFASEIKSILTYPNLSTFVNKSAIFEYLIYRYVPAPLTLFSGIYKLLPGMAAIWEKGVLTEKRYYSPPDQKPLKKKNYDRNVVETFLTHLEESVKIRMISDVPFGAFLSGGIDSSTVVALMSKYSSLPIKTFSVGFEEEDYNEASYAQIIANKFATDHHVLTITSDHLIDELPKLIHFRDAPISETADIPIYLLSKFARQSVKMVLTGEGGDEILGGYPKHVFERYVRYYQILPEFIRRNLFERLIHVLPYRFYRAKAAIVNLGIENPIDRLPRWFGSMTRIEVQDFLNFDNDLDYEGRIEAEKIQFNTNTSNSSLRRILYFDQTSWLPDNLLERGDRMTMAASLEARMPFMDHKLVEFVSSLPDKYRIRGQRTKWILREAMKPILPNDIIERPKMGFRAPVSIWFQTTMKDYLYDLLMGSDSLTKNYYKADLLKKILNEHTSGRQNHEKMLWCLLNLELWHRQYFN